LDVSDLERKKLMAKNQATASAHGKSVIRDRASGKPQRNGGKKQPKERRKILFPTEPTSIPHEEIDRAIAQVMSRRK
jgi:hypothetical protein